MPKKSRNAPVVKLADFKKKLREECSIVIEAEDGTRFRYLGPELLTDDQLKAMLALEKSDDPAAQLDVARIMMDDYDGFVAAGGSFAVVQAIVEQEQKRRRGELEDDEDEAAPGESVASSPS